MRKKKKTRGKSTRVWIQGKLAAECSDVFQRGSKAGLTNVTYTITLASIELSLISPFSSRFFLYPPKKLSFTQLPNLS